MKDDFLGLEVVSEEYIKCGDCQKPLVHVVVAETNEHRRHRGKDDIKTKFKVSGCPKCGGSSFESRIFEGSVIIDSATENTIFEIEDIDSSEGIEFFKLKVVEGKV